VIVAMGIAALIAPALKSLDQAYQFIQEYVGFISPGVLAIFLLGFFWKRTSAAAALTGSLLTIPVSAILKFLPVWTRGTFPDYPFLDRMTITFGIIVLIMIGISLAKPAAIKTSGGIVIDKKDFQVSPAFIFGSVIIVGILAGLYTVFW
jgi:solute:Na+ symporter, SSS family